MTCPLRVTRSKLVNVVFVFLQEQRRKTSIFHHLSASLVRESKMSDNSARLNQFKNKGKDATVSLGRAARAARRFLRPNVRCVRRSFDAGGWR